ncbi:MULTISPECIES: hypothetical protein [Acidiphilium]|uniref:Uncharacterized protein n=1 Tax=Acidiphilium rubrum TaxID=526 RepID=A0A8G2CNG7_ACIRU|nr:MULTISPECIES: hypothetical protein [Acidiphilium]SIR44086.1 hypothetical protein SAMN05421828_1332 [Acidiphilium rubrum]
MGTPPKTAKPQTRIVLASPSTNAGAMERLFLIEAYTPAYVGTYDASQNLIAMRLMRQTIENRLKSPGQYMARGATTEIEIIELGNQFAGFGTYPTLDPGMTLRLRDILTIANNPKHPMHAAFAQFVNDAITAATESTTPSVAKYPNVTAWRTKNSGSPGPSFHMLITLSGNTFYSTIPVPPMLHRDAKHSSRQTH